MTHKTKSPDNLGRFRDRPPRTGPGTHRHPRRHQPRPPPPHRPSLARHHPQLPLTGRHSLHPRDRQDASHRLVRQHPLANETVSTLGMMGVRRVANPPSRAVGLSQRPMRRAKDCCWRSRIDTWCRPSRWSRSPSNPRWRACSCSGTLRSRSTPSPTGLARPRRP